MKQHDFEKYVRKVTDNIRETLFSKNKSYGGSAVKDEGIFSRASVTDRLCMRIDDKLKRIQSQGFDGYGEDNLLDLIGYFVILRAHTNYVKDRKLFHSTSREDKPAEAEVRTESRGSSSSTHIPYPEGTPISKVSSRIKETAGSL